MCYRCSAGLKAEGAPIRDQLAASKRVCSKHHPTPGKEVETIDLTDDNEVPAPSERSPVADTDQPSIKKEPHRPELATGLPTPQSNAGPPLDPVITALAQRAQKDPYFKQLKAEVCGGRATADRVRQWDEHVAIARADLERKRSVGKRSAEPTEDSERPTKVQKLDEAAVPNRGGTKLTWTASRTQRQQQPAAEGRISGQPSVHEIAERLHARGKTDAVLATALSNLVKGCASADETQLYHRVWDEIKTGREPSQTPGQVSQLAQPAATTSRALAPQADSATTQPPPIAKKQTQNEKYSLQLPVDVASMALGWVPSRVFLTLDTVPDILAQKARTEPIIKTILENIRWHNGGNAREAEEYDLVVEDATRDIMLQRPEVGRISYISAVEVVRLREDKGKRTTYTPASFDSRHGLVDQGVEPRDNWTLVRRAVMRSDHWRRMNNEGLLEGLVRLYTVDSVTAEALRAMVRGDAGAQHKQLFDTAVANSLRTKQDAQAYRGGRPKKLQGPSAAESPSQRRPMTAREPDKHTISTSMIPPSADDRIYSKMPPCTVASRAVIFSESGRRLTRDSVPSMLASGLRDKLWSAEVMPRIADATATAKDMEVYDSAVKQAIQTLQQERPDQEVPAYRAAVVESLRTDTTTTNVATNSSQDADDVGSMHSSGGAAASDGGEQEQRALIRKTLMSTRFVDRRNEQRLIAALILQMTESNLIRDAVQAIVGARGHAADIDFFEMTVWNVLDKWDEGRSVQSAGSGCRHIAPAASAVLTTANGYHPTGPNIIDDLAIAKLTDVERRAVARCALSKIDTTRQPNNQPLITAIVSRAVVHSEFEATVKAIVDSEASDTQRREFQTAMNDILRDVRPRPSGISEPPMLNANKALTLLACPDSSSVSSSVVVKALAGKAGIDAAFRHLLRVIDAGGAPMAKVVEFSERQAELVEEICSRNRSDAEAARSKTQAQRTANAGLSALEDGSSRQSLTKRVADSTRTASPGFRMPTAALSVPDESISRQSLAKRILLRLRMPYLAEEPLVVTLALRAEEGRVLEDAIKAVAAGSATVVDIKYFDTWIDSITKWIKDTDPGVVQAANARSMADQTVSRDHVERYVEQRFGPKYEHWTVPTTNRHTIDNYMGTKMSMYKFANLEALVESVRSSQAVKGERQRFHDAADRAADMLKPDLRTKVTDADASFHPGPATARHSGGARGNSSLGMRKDQKAKESTSSGSLKQGEFTAMVLATKAMTLVLGNEFDDASEDVDPVVNKLAANARSDRKLKALMSEVALGTNKKASIRAFKLRVGRLLAEMVGVEKERWREAANVDHSDDESVHAETSRRGSLPATATMARDSVDLGYAGSGLPLYAYAFKAVFQAENRHASSSDPVVDVLAARLREEPGLKATAKLIADRSCTKPMRDDFDFAVEEAKETVETTSRNAHKEPAWQVALERMMNETEATKAARGAASRKDKNRGQAKFKEVLRRVDPSKAQVLAVKALMLTHDTHREEDANDPVAMMLATNARSRPAFDKLLLEIATTGQPKPEHLEVFGRCVGEYTGTRNVGQTPSWSAVSDWTKGALSATTALDRDATAEPPSRKECSDKISDSDASALQTLAMRARITLKDPKLPAFGILIEKVIANARADPGFTEILDYVAGAAGHMRPNEDKLRIFKGYVDGATKLLEAEKNQQPADAAKPLPEKLSPEEWPLRFSWSYTKYNDQNARSSTTKSKDSLKATVKYRNHPDCGFNGHPYYHDVPYPLSLLPKATWEAMHNNKPDGAACSCCRRPCKPSAQQMKLFLVAERLSWAAGTFGVKARGKNEEALWAVNYELGIEEPVMLSGQETVFGGKQSGKNAWYPFQNKAEADLVMQVVEKADVLSEESWQAWKNLATEQLRRASHGFEQNMDDEVSIVGERKALDDKSRNARRSPRKASATSPAKALATPPSSAMDQKVSSPGQGAACSSMTLVEMYSSLDKIERMAPISAHFLEAYAEKVHAEVCKQCWFEQNVAAHGDGEADDEED